MEYQLIAPINPGYSTIEQILTNRGIKIEDTKDYLDIASGTKVCNYDPLLLKNI